MILLTAVEGASLVGCRGETPPAGGSNRFVINLTETNFVSSLDFLAAQLVLHKNELRCLHIIEHSFVMPGLLFVP